MRQGQVAAGRQGFAQDTNCRNCLVVGDEMEHRYEQHGQRLVEIQQAVHQRVLENVRRVSHIALNAGRERVALQDGFAV